MKTKQFFLGMLAAAALVGCSSDDTLSNDSNPTVGDGNPRYMSINIMSTSSALGTRADYENGSDAENAVNKVRFYFFTNDGNPANVKKTATGYVNYYDWTPESFESGDPAQTVEEKIGATIVISTPDGDLVPSKMMAVLNPDKITTLGNASRGLYSVRSIQQDWAALTSQENGFVMCNSVYASNAGERVSTATVAASNLCQSKADALANPVNIYVERNVAKVALKYDASLTLDNNGKLALKDAKGNDLKVTKGDAEVQVYVKPLYWTLTATTEKANLSKHINPTWRTNLLSPEGLWSSVDYHRSFWAVNCLTENEGTSGTDDAGAKYYTFNQITAQGHAMGGSDVIYTNENAATNYNSGEQRKYPTQVICAMQLVDADGNALEVVEYGGMKYVGIDNLKKKMLSTIDAKPWKKTTSGTTTVYKELSPEDVTFKTEINYNSDIAGSQENEGGRYYVRMTLTDEAAASEWYTVTGTSASGDKEYESLATTNVTSLLTGLGHAKIWKTGYTYYSFKVRHLAQQDAGMYGVVRNHSYVCSIDDIVGFGTPVYNPDEVIYPETPVDENVYIGAKINILQWRLVPSTVSLGKTE